MGGGFLCSKKGENLEQIFPQNPLKYRTHSIALKQVTKKNIPIIYCEQTI